MLFKSIVEKEPERESIVYACGTLYTAAITVSGVEVVFKWYCQNTIFSLAPTYSAETTGKSRKMTKYTPRRWDHPCFGLFLSRHPNTGYRGGPRDTAARRRAQRRLGERKWFWSCGKKKT